METRLGIALATVYCYSLPSGEVELMETVNSNRLQGSTGDSLPSGEVELMETTAVCPAQPPKCPLASLRGSGINGNLEIADNVADKTPISLPSGEVELMETSSLTHRCSVISDSLPSGEVELMET
ncbi:hypothetical protein GlitD10_0185 [Gloeomargarita lithophora Alchichica-D10]|uniref:Uncharacterized protein n=1 Tax=Gloeomargarita lithophora Alchichica-D10 TaxID=1188229 RepID=A0A1J0A988_9CYAN|nr:hypothetical protein GlitD10_0185 [Gloeomargarita lithophora Alchichica-D10]